MALYRDLKFNEGSGNLLTDEVASATLAPENGGHLFNWGYDSVNGEKKSFLGISRTNKKPDTVNYNWIGTPYGASFFDGSTYPAWTVAVLCRPIMRYDGILFNSQLMKLAYRLQRFQWGNGFDLMVDTAEVIRGKWVTLIFSSNDGDNVNVWFEDMTTAGMLRTFSKGANQSRLGGSWLRVMSENAESGASMCHMSRLTFWTHELNESERVAWQTENGGPSSSYPFQITNHNPKALSFAYIQDETDSPTSSSYMDAEPLNNRTRYRWRQDGDTCQSCLMGYVERNLDQIYFRSKVYFPTDIDLVTGAFYTNKFRIHGLFRNNVDLAGDLFGIHLQGDFATDVLTLQEVIYDNSIGSNTITLDGRVIEKGKDLIFETIIDFANGTIGIWINREMVLDPTGAGAGLTLDIRAEYFGIGPWQGIHMNPVNPPTDYTGGEYYESEQHVGEVPRQSDMQHFLNYY